MQLAKKGNGDQKIPEKVMWALIDAIESGQIKVGEELTSERELAETLGVGRGSLRECLGILEFLGAIENRGYRKVVVRDADYIRRIISLVRVSDQEGIQDDFSEFRRVTEAAIAELASQRATEEDLEQLRAALAALEAEPMDYQNDVHFHDALARASHNMMLAASIHLVNAMLGDIRTRFGGHEDYQKKTHASHCAIYEAVRDHDAARARAEMEKHLQIVEEYREKYPEEFE